MALNTDFLVKMPMSQKLLVLAAIVALLFLGYWLLFDNSLSDEYQAQTGILQDKKTQLKKLQTVEKDKQKLDRELQEKERKLEKAKEKLPTETEMERLLLTVNELGQKNGIKFSVFKPGGERKEGQLYIEVPIDLKFNGQYLYVMNFFYEVSILPRIINFSGISLSAGRKGGVNDISVNCTATTYKFIGR